ncbi:MAG TPA: PH domain-containing protein [Micromonosporaceae bacterium]
MSRTDTLRFRRSGALIFAAVIGFICVLPVVFGPDLSGDLHPVPAATNPDGAGTATVRWFLTPVLLIPIAFAIWAWRSGTDADRDGIRIRALLGQRHIGWSQISELGADRRDRAEVRLIDGRTVQLPAVTRADLPRLVEASGQKVQT